MKVFLTIWISAVLIQEVIPGTLVRLPRQTPKRPALVATEYEAKYEQTGHNGNENSGLFSGKQEIVHDNCSDNWNVFADKCAAMIKDLVASLASTVSSRPGDATKLQLQIKNTFKHVDNSHNSTHLNDTGKSNPTPDLSSLFNNVTINTVAPTASNNGNSAGANNEDESNDQSSNENNGSDLAEGVAGLGSNGDGDVGNGSSDGSDNNFGTLNSRPAGVSRKSNTALDHAKNPGFSPENDEGSEAGSNSRRQAEYPQVSWQPGNKTRPPQNNHGRSNNISRSPYPFIVTPQPYSAYGSPSPATYSDGNNLPNGGNGFESDGQRNSNPSPAGASGESGIPLRIQTLPASNTYKSEPASDSHYKAAARIPVIGGQNSANPTVTGVPPAFSNHQDAALVPAIPAPGGHNSKNGHSLSKAPVTDDSYDSKPVPVQPMTDGLSDSQPGTIPLIEPRGPKFPNNNSPNSGSYSNKPQFVLNTSTNESPENPQSSDSHALSKNQNNRPVVEIIQPVSSITPKDSWLDSVSGTPNTKPVLTIGKPEVFSAEEGKRVEVPVINSDSNIPESRGPESQWDATNPLSTFTGRNPNPSSADVNTGSSAIPEVPSASIKDESEHTTSASTTNKFRDTIPLPLDRIPPLVHVKPALPEADSHKSEDPSNAGHTLSNPLDRTAVPDTLAPSSLSQTFDAAGRRGSENVYGKPQRSAPVTVYPVYIPTTIDVKPEENSDSNGNDNSGKSNTGEDDYEENHPEDAEKTIATVLQPPGQSLQDNGKPQSNTEAGDSIVQNGIGQSTALGSVSNTYPDNEDGEDCDENTGSDPATNAEIGNDANPAVHPVSKISDPVEQIIRGSVPASEDGDDSDATTPAVVFPEQSVSTVSDPVVEGNVTASDEYEDCDENEETGNDATTPAGLSLVQPVSTVSDPVVQEVQGNVPYPDVGGENTGSGNDPNIIADSRSNTGVANGATTLVAASPVQPVPEVSDPAVQVVQGNVPASDEGDDCDEIAEDGGDATTPVAMSPIKPVPKKILHTADPAVQVVQGNVPDSDVGGESTGFSNDPNSVSDRMSNTGTANDAITPVEVYPTQLLSAVSGPEGQSLQSGGSPQSDIGSGVDGVQNGDSQLTAIHVTPPPKTDLADGYTPVSTSSEGQSDNPQNEDLALYKPTTFQTTATDPTSPQSILIPTESTGRLTHVSTASQSSVRGSTSPLSKEGDDDDEDEDCCSCESCSEDEIIDPKQYKENACRNLEEARRELKAIFDKIKKKLKCGRKALSTVATR